MTKCKIRITVYTNFSLKFRFRNKNQLTWERNMEGDLRFQLGKELPTFTVIKIDSS